MVVSVIGKFVLRKNDIRKCNLVEMFHEGPTICQTQTHTEILLIQRYLY